MRVWSPLNTHHFAFLVFGLAFGLDFAFLSSLFSALDVLEGFDVVFAFFA